MTTQQDCSVGFGIESVYGTAVVPSRFYEFTEEKFAYSPEFLQGEGLRVGAPIARQSRRSVGKIDAGGELTVEATTRGLGLLLNAALGTSTVTVTADTPVRQQLHTLTTTDWLPSLTVQKGIPPLGGGPTHAYNFPGSVCSKLSIDASNTDIVQLKSTWLSRDCTAGGSYAAPSYGTDSELFTFTGGSIMLGGSVTVPTATALSSGGTAAANVVDFNLEIDNKLDGGGWRFGGSGRRTRQPALGLREVSGSFTAEYDGTVMRDAYLNQTPMALVMRFQTATTIGASSKATLEIVAPCIMLDGEIPASNKGDVISQSIDYRVLDGGVAASPLYIVYRTLDTAL